jgi:hypothetical protein
MFRGYEAIKALAKECRVRVADLLVLAEKNDPFYAGLPSQRDKAAWFAELWRRFHYTSGVHLRRVHYRIVSSEVPERKHDGTPYENTEGCWDYLGEAGKYARYLSLVSPDAFEDHRNPPPHIHMAPNGARRSPTAWLTALEPWRLPRIESNLMALLSLPLPTVDVIDGYTYEAIDQPYQVEVWVEKSTMDDVLLPLCAELHVNLVTSIGFQSITSAIRVLQRAHTIMQLGKPTRIFYISDFDPAGDGMPVAVARQLEYWLQEYAPDCDIKLTPLGLTREQVITYQLPRIPIKDSDARKAGFEERYGEGAVELDALEALYPGTLAELVREAAGPYRDLDLAARFEEAEAEAEHVADEAWSEQTAPYQEEIDEITAGVRTIVTGYQARLSRMDAALQAELRPWRERMERLRHAVAGEMDRFHPILPLRPEADIEPIDEEAWLFDARRDYLTQLAVYKARKHRHGVDDVPC